MKRAKAGDVVSVHFTGILKNGKGFASTQDKDPLEFAIGGGSTFKNLRMTLLE